MTSLDAQTRHRANSESRVHFKEAQITPDHTGEILVEKLEGNTFNAHIGFLQEKRKYAISVTIPHYLGDEVSLEEKITNVTVEGFKADPKKTKHILSCEMVVDCEGPTEKVLKIKGSGGITYTIKLSFTSIGVGKGTPMLKKGIHCIGHEELDSDISEMSVEGTS